MSILRFFFESGQIKEPSKHTSKVYVYIYIYPEIQDRLHNIRKTAQKINDFKYVSAPRKVCTIFKIKMN